MFFRKKKKQDAEQGEQPQDGQQEGAESVESSFSPEKAAKFFEHARAVHEASQFEYAMNLWLRGLRQDPTNMEGLTSFFESAARFMAGSKSKKLSKDSLSAFSGRSTLDRFLATLLQSSVKPGDAGLAVQAAGLAAKLGLYEQTTFLGGRALGIAGRLPKPRKDHFVQLKNIFVRVENYERAVEAGEFAMRLDPADGKLAAEIRNLSAQAAMSRGGFDEAGREGGFRANVRDVEKQRRLEEEERSVKTEESLDRMIESAKADYEARPTDKHAIGKYVRLLVERGREEDERVAQDLLTRAYEQTEEFRFRQTAGDIRLRAMRRKIAQLKAAADRAEGEEAERLGKELESARAELLGAETEEYRERVKAYPTDLPLKYELGKRLYERGEHEEAIALFQEAKSDVKNRVRVLNYLGLSFYAMGWYDEAVATFRQALSAHHNDEDEFGMELRYGLLIALQKRAVEQTSLDDAEEANKLAGSIAIQQINFKDIRDRREQLRSLLNDLRQGRTPAN